MFKPVFVQEDALPFETGATPIAYQNQNLLIEPHQTPVKQTLIDVTPSKPTVIEVTPTSVTPSKPDSASEEIHPYDLALKEKGVFKDLAYIVARQPQLKPLRNGDFSWSARFAIYRNGKRQFMTGSKYLPRKSQKLIKFYQTLTKGQRLSIEYKINQHGFLDIKQVFLR